MNVGGRYLTMTGQHVENTPTDILPAPRTEALLQAAVEKVRPSGETDTKPPNNKTNGHAYGETFHGRVNSAALANLGASVHRRVPHRDTIHTRVTSVFERSRPRP